MNRRFIEFPSMLAKRFVAGETLDQVVPKVWQINNENIDVTLDLLEKT